ncbi:MAG: ROK family transcriptional regulator [Alphaproteobacteria bacterium]
MKTADPELMRAINRFHVMDAIRKHGPISRVEIAQAIELSPTTISAITAALLDDALITPRNVVPLGEAARGRPRIMLELNPDAAYVVGVKLSPHQISVATTNFRADVLKSLTLPVRTDRQSADVIADIVEDGVRHCVADAGLPFDKIGGVCVGLPGIVEHATGICRQSPIFRQPDVPLAEALGARLGVAVTVESDVNLATLAEHWFGHGRGHDDFIVVAVEHSLGLGVMHKGELVRGAHGLSADLGDMIVWPGDAGGNGPARLADFASEAAILAAARGAVPSDPAFDFARTVRRARDCDAATKAVFEKAGVALGYAVANIVTLFAPSLLIIAGGALGAGDLLTGPLLATVDRVTPPPLRRAVTIIDHCWGDDVWARGAAALTLRQLYSAPWSTSGPAMRPQASDEGEVT